MSGYNFNKNNVFLSENLFYLNSVDPDEMLHYCKSTCLAISRKQRVKKIKHMILLLNIYSYDEYLLCYSGTKQSLL